MFCLPGVAQKVFTLNSSGLAIPCSKCKCLNLFKLSKAQ